MPRSFATSAAPDLVTGFAATGGHGRGAVWRAVDVTTRVDASGAVTINYGVFLNAVINFLIVAFAIFVLVKQINRFKKAEEAAPPPGPSESEKLLAEIRDLLKSK